MNTTGKVRVAMQAATAATVISFATAVWGANDSSFHLRVHTCSLQPESTACMRLLQWFGPNCSGFYDAPSPAPVVLPAAPLSTRRGLPQTRVLEDFCKQPHSNRTSRDSEVHIANELFLLRPLNIAWVDNKKAASTTIGSDLC